ncbi:MAG: alkaline phosphatase family protein [Deltaproteobacteria bacterium]|nr:alkaline phosphatase family protein [Deltaproteobacteria bacterium]
MIIVFLSPALVFGSPKIVIIEFHGLKQGIIHDYLDQLPNFRKLIYGSDKNQPFIYFPNVWTTISAASMPTIAAMYTGLYPQRTGVVSTIWFDRTTQKGITMRSVFQERINKMLEANHVKTLFQYAEEAGKRTMTTMLIVNNGAEWKINSSLFFWGNSSALGFLHNGYFFPYKSYTDPKTISAFLNGHICYYDQSLAGIYQNEHTLPDIMVLQLLGTDLFSHFPDPTLAEADAPIEEIQFYYTRTILDPQIGRIIDFFQSTDFQDDIIYILLSQQGSLKIQKHIPDHILHQILSTAYALPSDTISNAQAEAVIMLGACTKEVYLKNRESNNWSDPPRLLEDVQPAVDLILDNDSVRESLNSLVIRQYPDERHGGLDENEQYWSLAWETYLKGKRDGESFFRSLRPLSDMAQRFELGEFVVTGLNRQYTRETAPDIKLINKKGHYFEKNKNKYGHHGSYYPEDLRVFFWLTGPGMKSFSKGQHVQTSTQSTLDLVPMVCHLLGIPIPEGLDGVDPLDNMDLEICDVDMPSQ